VRFVAAISATLVAAVLLAVMTCLVAGAPSSTLAVGDQLAYGITVELQQHHVRGKGKNSDTVSESSAQGIATFTVYSIGSDGTALANVALNLQGIDAGQPVALQTTTPGKVLSDGQLRTKAQVGLGVTDAFAAANTMIAEIGQHGQLALGKTWTNRAKTPFVTMTMKRTVNGQTNYQGLASYTLQSVGVGALLRTTDGRPAFGDISVGGTTYYDDADRLFLGEAFRTLMVVAPPGQSAIHDDYSSTFNIVLNSWTHASPAPASSEQPAQEQASPEEESPPPTQTALPLLYSTPYPTTITSPAP
jgi:hypothetical protein